MNIFTAQVVNDVLTCVLVHEQQWQPCQRWSDPPRYCCPWDLNLLPCTCLPPTLNLRHGNIYTVNMF